MDTQSKDGDVIAMFDAMDHNNWPVEKAELAQHGITNIKSLYNFYKAALEASGVTERSIVQELFSYKVNC